MGVFSKKIALFAISCLASAAGTDPSDASSCLEMAHDDEVPELVKVELLQSDLTVRRAKAVQLEDHVSLLTAAGNSSLVASNEQLDAKVEQLTDKMDRLEVKEPALSAGGVQETSIAFHVNKIVMPFLFRSVTAIDVFHLLEQFPQGNGQEPGPPAWMTVEGDDGIEIQWQSIEVENSSLVWRALALYVLCCWLSFAGPTLLVAAVYRCFKTPVVCQVQPGQTTQTEPTGQWSHDFCDCCSALDVCFCASFFPAIRWSETMSYVPALSCCGVAGFWGWLLVSLLVLMPCVFCPLVVFIILADRRSALRQQFNIKGSCPMDCLLYCFCSICAMTQEGREVEDAVRKGSKCLVGEPVAV